MHPNEIIKDVESSEIFKEFRTAHPSYFLATVFSLGSGWNVGYYAKKEDRMVTFTALPVVMSPPQEVFRKDAIAPLDMTKVQVAVDKAEEAAKVLHGTKYNLHPITKTIIQLHQQNGPEYNITFITTTFNVINIKINAETGELIKDFIESTLAYKAKEEKD
jgi:hypothetical protein